MLNIRESIMCPNVCIGDRVRYRLSAEDIERIRHGQHTARALNQPHRQGGDILPAVVTAVWPAEFGPGKPGVNLQVFLDGDGSYWATSRQYSETTEPGTWFGLTRA